LAQAPGSPVDPRLVLVGASVSDRSGEFVSDLPQSAFRVYENGVEQPLTMFREELLPLSMGLVIDNSASMRAERAMLAAAAKALVELPSPRDQMFIVAFNSGAYLDQDWTNDESKLIAAVDKTEARGGSAWRDAVSLSLDRVQSGGKNQTKVLFLITDGNDDASKISTLELLRKARQSGVPIYCIGLFNGQAAPESRNARRALHQLAEASGGQDLYPKNRSELDLTAAAMTHMLRSQYLLGYSPSGRALDAASRDIRVVVDRPGLAIHIRSSSSPQRSSDGQ
jgi:Ca-activated chloride channel family protein